MPTREGGATPKGGRTSENRVQYVDPIWEMLGRESRARVLGALAALQGILVLLGDQVVACPS